MAISWNDYELQAWCKAGTLFALCYADVGVIHGGKAKHDVLASLVRYTVYVHFGFAGQIISVSVKQKKHIRAFLMCWFIAGIHINQSYFNHDMLLQSSYLVVAVRGERWGKHGGKHDMLSSLFCWHIISIVSTAVVRSAAWKHTTHMVIPDIYRLITGKYKVTESYFYLAVSREKHRKQATRVWEELAHNVERWQSDDGSTPPSRCAQATIQSNCNAIGRDDIALGWGCMRLNERRGWSSVDEAVVVVIYYLACQLDVELLFDGAVHVWSGIST